MQFFYWKAGKNQNRVEWRILKWKVGNRSIVGKGWLTSAASYLVRQHHDVCQHCWDLEPPAGSIILRGQKSICNLENLGSKERQIKILQELLDLRNKFLPILSRVDKKLCSVRHSWSIYSKVAAWERYSSNLRKVSRVEIEWDCYSISTILHVVFLFTLPLTGCCIVRHRNSKL